MKNQKPVSLESKQKTVILDVRAVQLSDLKKIAGQLLQEILDKGDKKTISDRALAVKLLKEIRESMEQLDSRAIMRQLKKQLKLKQ